MKTVHTLFVTAILLSATYAQAALESRLSGLAVYDTDLNITWLANANVIGLTDWNTANTWATSLTVSGIGGWRLPTTPPSDPSCTAGASTGGLCTGSEMGHLFYFEMGGAPSTASTSFNGLFYNIQNYQQGGYWSSSEYSTNAYWDFNFYSGGQGIATGGYAMGAWAVHNGDVASVPVPAAAWLLGSGLLGLTATARRHYEEASPVQA